MPVPCGFSGLVLIVPHEVDGNRMAHPRGGGAGVRFGGITDKPPLPVFEGRDGGRLVRRQPQAHEPVAIGDAVGRQANPSQLVQGEFSPGDPANACGSGL